MDSLLWSVKTFLEDKQVHNPLVALSGGHDSMVLCSALLQLGIKFSCAHCNYQLRPNESDLDARFVQEFCQTNKVPLHLKIQPLNSLESSNIQEKARKLRHDYFKEVMTEYSYDFLLIAHHAEDRIESFFINLTRGSGIRGLSTMPDENDQILRPFLLLTKSSLNEFAIHNNVQWREDSSNSQTKYIRNIIRHEITPLFEKINQAFIQNSTRSINHLDELDHFVQTYRIQWKKDSLEKINKGYIIHIRYNELDYFIFEFLASIGFHPNTVAEIKNHLHDSGKKFESHDEWTAYIDRSKIIVEKSEDLTFDEELTIYEDHKLIHLPFAYLKFSNPEIIKSDEYLKAGSNFAYFDYDKIRFPLQLRVWQPGDRMEVLGMNGMQKKIQDILVDRKVSVPEKKKTLVLLSNNKIVWLVNHNISEVVKLDSNSKKMIKLEYIPLEDQ